VRVIGGTAKGRRLLAPPGTDVRPTSDRARQALFTMLDARIGGVDDLVVADLACGSGALGIEALSRGAASCTFVDTSRRSLEAAKQNLAAVGLEGSAARFVVDDLAAWAKRQLPASIDLVLADPPYAWDGWGGLLGSLADVADVVVAESDRDVPPTPGWGLLRSLRHGSTVVSVLVPTDQAAP
jgi:16S rRNA (guanine966-N2)-methyltransferase